MQPATHTPAALKATPAPVLKQVGPVGRASPSESPGRTRGSLRSSSQIRTLQVTPPAYGFVIPRAAAAARTASPPAPQGTAFRPGMRCVSEARLSSYGAREPNIRRTPSAYVVPCVRPVSAINKNCASAFADLAPHLGADCPTRWAPGEVSRMGSVMSEAASGKVIDVLPAQKRATRSCREALCLNLAHSAQTTEVPTSTPTPSTPLPPMCSCRDEDRMSQRMDRASSGCDDAACSTGFSEFDESYATARYASAVVSAAPCTRDRCPSVSGETEPQWTFRDEVFVVDAAVDTPRLSPPSKVAALLRATDAVLGFVNGTLGSASVATLESHRSEANLRRQSAPSQTLTPLVPRSGSKPEKLREVPKDVGKPASVAPLESHRSEANLRRQSAPSQTLKPLVPRSGSKSEKSTEVPKDVGKPEAQAHRSKFTPRSANRQRPSTVVPSGRGADNEKSADVLVTRALDAARGTQVREGRWKSGTGTVAVRRNGTNQLERGRNDPRSPGGSDIAKGGRRDPRRSNKAQTANTDPPQGQTSNQSPRTRSSKRPSRSNRSPSTGAIRTEAGRLLPHPH